LPARITYHVGTVKCIADNQSAQQKLRAALRDAYPAAYQESRQPTVAEIINTPVPYLDAVIDESLRCNSPLPIFAREAMLDTTVLGRQIPKGTQIFFLVTGPDFKTPGFHIDDATRSQSSREKRRAGTWDAEDMELFKPERWLKQDEAGQTIHDAQAGPMLAFGLGPRGCFGKRLAYMEMRMVLALLMWNFDFKKLGEPFSSYEAYDSITVMPKHCYVALEKLK
jgi:cytochrome P450